MMNLFVMKAYAHSQLYPHQHPHGATNWDLDLILSSIFGVAITALLIWLVLTQLRRVHK